MDTNHIKQFEFITAIKQAKELILGPSAKRSVEAQERHIKMDSRTIYRTLSSKGTPLQTGVDR
jgi:hypothetical protein